MQRMPKQLGKYELLERLGSGGVAEVWKALDTQLHRFVAIKLLQPDLREDPNFITRFRREAQFIASLHHPNIVQIHDFQVYQSDESEQESRATTPIAYMVMDYIEGQTLGEYIRKTSNQGQIPQPTELVNLFTSISLAIDYAHEKGMIHRDIKPANIMLDERNTLVNPMGEPILTDFGVAKLLSASTSTLSGAQLGTPLYTSPEQARGYPGNELSDLYALGVILYEMTTGVMPFRGSTPHDVIMQHINTNPTPPELINPRIPPALSQVILRSLAKEPAARFSSAAALTAAVAEALEVPVPESLGQPSYPLDRTNAPTIMSAPATDGRVDSSSSSATPASTPAQRSGGPISSSGTPNLTPIMVYMTPTPSQTAQATAPAPPAPPLPTAPPVASVAPPRPRRRRRGWQVALIALLLLVLVGSGLGISYFLLKPAPPAATTQPGHVYYLSSGQINFDTAQGIADQMQIDLQNVRPPQSGKSYYAWLLPDKHPDKNPDLVGPRPIQAPLLLSNNLPVNNGRIHYIYDGSKTQHNNLLSNTSRLLITEEAAGRNPTTPSSDHASWRYYGEIPQAQIPKDVPSFSALTHIRHLFYDETNITILGLKGGLDFWLSRNTEKLVEWSASARDDWYGAQTSDAQMSLMRDLCIRILDYLDGSANVHVDVPPGTPLLVDPLSAKVSLLSVAPEQDNPANFDRDPLGYIPHTSFHVAQIGKAIDISPEARQLTVRIVDAIKRAGAYLTNVRQDAIKIFQMRNDPAQLKLDSTKALLDDMTTNALNAYVGQVDPTTNQRLPAILDAHYAIQQLATITLTTQVPQSL